MLEDRREVVQATIQVPIHMALDGGPCLANRTTVVCQIASNFVHQAAAGHFLTDAAKVNAEVVSMRSMTSGILQCEAGLRALEWQCGRDRYEDAHGFVCSDSRVHASVHGMCWPEGLEMQVTVINGRVPPIDRMTIRRSSIEADTGEARPVAHGAVGSLSA